MFPNNNALKLCLCVSAAFVISACTTYEAMPYEPSPDIASKIYLSQVHITVQNVDVKEASIDLDCRAGGKIVLPSDVPLNHYIATAAAREFHRNQELNGLQHEYKASINIHKIKLNTGVGVIAILPAFVPINGSYSIKAELSSDLRHNSIIDTEYTFRSFHNSQKACEQAAVELPRAIQAFLNDIVDYALMQH